MAQKRKKKRSSTKKTKQVQSNYSFALVILVIGLVIGIMIGRNPDSTASLSEKLTQIPNQIEQLFNGTNKKQESPPTIHNESSSTQASEAVTMRFLDVGQGDATLIQGADGTNILIDTGRYDDKEKRIIDYLNQYIGVGGKIDLLILTHNDSDHIGHADLVVDYFDVKKVWMNGHDATTKVYEKLLDSIATKDLVYEEPKSGEVQQVGPFHLEVYNPTEEARSNQNDDSIITRVTVGKFSSMFSGDAASRVEQQIIEQNVPIQSTLYHVGHHGSKESSSLAWLEKINPKIAIYSAGKNNSYHHPSVETIQRLNSIGIPTYGTDKNGTITVSIEKDGHYQIKTEKGS